MSLDVYFREITPWKHISNIIFMQFRDITLTIKSRNLYYRICNKGNSTGATCSAWTTYPSEAPEFTPSFSVVHVGRCLVLDVTFCKSLFVLLVIVLSVLRFTASDYPFGIFWPLCCLVFFDLRLLVTPLVSSNFS